MRDDPQQSVADDLRQWLDDDRISPAPPTSDPVGDAPDRRRRVGLGVLLTVILAPWLLIVVAIVAGRGTEAPPADGRPGGPVPPASAPARSAHRDAAGPMPAPSVTTP